MPVDFDSFVKWAENKFGDVKLRGNEVLINSIFTEDKKHHLWCNPSGGKNFIKSGVYHCWKTDKKGTLVSLVMQVEGCTKKTAFEILGINEPHFRAPEDIDFDITFGEGYKEPDFEQENLKEIKIPPNCHLINVAPAFWYNRAKEYLNNRKIKNNDLYICTAGKYEGRIIIPYRNSKGSIIYFNGRTITNNSLRYRGPEKEIGVGKEDVLYFTNFPQNDSKIYLCEGEFDAMALHQCGLNAAASGGKNLSDKQAVMLSPYKVCLALDADSAGRSAISHMHNKIMQYGRYNYITTVSPPAQYKDWNNFYCHHDTKIILAYLEMNEKKLELDAIYG